MPYFIILPAYLALLFTLIIVAVAFRFVPRLRAASGYIIGGAVGTFPSFFAANAAVWLVGLLPVWVDRGYGSFLPGWVHDVSMLFVASVLLLGPFVASCIAVVLGFAAGAGIVHKRRGRHVMS
jgi:hypothetical protein